MPAWALDRPINNMSRDWPIGRIALLVIPPFLGNAMPDIKRPRTRDKEERGKAIGKLVRADLLFTGTSDETGTYGRRLDASHRAIVVVKASRNMRDAWYTIMRTMELRSVDKNGNERDEKGNPAFCHDDAPRSFAFDVFGANVPLLREMHYIDPFACIIRIDSVLDTKLPWKAFGSGPEKIRHRPKEQAPPVSKVSATQYESMKAARQDATLTYVAPLPMPEKSPTPEMQSKEWHAHPGFDNLPAENLHFAI